MEEKRIWKTYDLDDSETVAGFLQERGIAATVEEGDRIVGFAIKVSESDYEVGLRIIANNSPERTFDKGDFDRLP